MSLSTDDVRRAQREREVSGEIVALLVTAMDEISDAVHLFRIDETSTLTRLYQNRAAAAAPEVSFAEITEALTDGGAVLRAGTRRDSVCEMRARYFTSFAGRFAVAIERDVTERDRLERAYDDAALRAQHRAERYARLCRLVGQPWPARDDRISAILEFALRETHMGSALLLRRVGSVVRVWRMAGDPALEIGIPASLSRAAHHPGSGLVGVPWPGAPCAARFSFSCVGLGTDERVLLALGRAHARPSAEERDAPRFVAEFLALCATMAGAGAGGDAIPP
jgi:hypothetical protein